VVAEAIGDRAQGNVAKRGVFMVLGTVFLALGVLGAALPILPTTPFVLLAAWCYARGSVRLYRWLLASRMFGPLIRRWEADRSITLRSKIVATVMMWAAILSSATWATDRMTVRIFLLTCAVGTSTWMWGYIKTAAAEEPTPRED